LLMPCWFQPSGLGLVIKHSHLHLTRRFLILSFVGPLAVSLCRIVTLVTDQILWSIVMPSGEVRFQDTLDARGVSGLCVERCTTHMGNHPVAASKRILCIAKRVVLWRRLREPDVATVAVELARFQSLSDIFLDDNSTTSCIDQIGPLQNVSLRPFGAIFQETYLSSSLR